MSGRLPAYDLMVIAQATEDGVRCSACPRCGAVLGAHLLGCPTLPKLPQFQPLPLPEDIDEWTEEERAEHPAAPAYHWEGDVRP